MTTDRRAGKEKAAKSTGSPLLSEACGVTRGFAMSLSTVSRYNQFTHLWRSVQMPGPNLDLTEEHKLIRDTARDFAQNEIAPIAAHFDETGEFPRETIKKMGALGLMGIEVPEEYGGAAMDTLAYVLAMIEIAKADVSHSTIMSVNNSLYCHGILKFGTEEQKKKYVTPIASGQKIGAYSLTEPMSGSDAGTMKSRAVRDGDHYVINGRKSWVTSGPVAAYMVLFTMTQPEKGHNGVT